MDIKIIYSLKEYQESFQSLLGNYLLQYEEIEEIDFVISEIKKYKICFQIISLPIESAFNIYFRIESKTMDLIAFSLTQEILDSIFLNENSDYYFKMYQDLVKPLIGNGSMADCEKKIIQTRMVFPKIISFLETIKSELEINDRATSIISTLNWQGSALEFSELVKAIIESGFIGKVKNETVVFEKMKQFFNVEDFDKSDKLKQVRNRTKELTPVINTLETSLLNWIKRKD
jgi:hypothetical protein